MGYRKTSFRRISYTYRERLWRIEGVVYPKYFIRIGYYRGSKIT